MDTVKLGVISDVHANLPALQTALDFLDGEGVTEVLCCGDVVGYGPWPNECAALIRSRSLLCISGNHDGAACERVALTHFNGVARTALAWTVDELSAETLEFLRACPPTLSHDRFFATHGSPRDPTWEYITDPWVAYQNFQHFEQRIGWFGHSHLPTVFWGQGGNVDGGRVDGEVTFLLEPGRRYLINPGSVGQPRDGDWRLSLALWTCEGATEQVHFYRLEYDVKRTQEQLKKAGFPSSLGSRLVAGR